MFRTFEPNARPRRGASFASSSFATSRWKSDCRWSARNDCVKSLFMPVTLADHGCTTAANRLQAADWADLVQPYDVAAGTQTNFPTARRPHDERRTREAAEAFRCDAVDAPEAVADVAGPERPAPDAC